MSNNDDLFIVIVEDDDESISHCHIKIDPNIKIKQELEEDKIEVKVEQLLDTAAEHGEVLDLDEAEFDQLIGEDVDASPFNIKTEYVENNIIDFVVDDDYAQKSPVRNDSDNDFVPSDHSEGESEYEKDDSDYEFESEANLKSKGKSPRSGRRTKTHFWKGRQRDIVSYVQFLRNEYPDLKEDEELLISCVVELMKQIQRPEPPEDYYVMNGIMFECVHCGYCSMSIPNAQRHFQEKHGERYLYCFACGTDFRSSTNLYKHEKRCDAQDIDIVLKARAKSLGRKGRSRPYLQDFSNESSRDDKNMKERRFQCTECSASFVTKYGLESHLRMHRGERPFVCPHCPRAYTSQTTLARHKLKHGPQEFICDHCGRSFKLKAALILHMDTHAPLKKFPCGECPKRYSQKSALLVHVNRDHRNLPQPFPCQICPKRYPRMSVLKNHMKKAHGMLIMTRKMFFKQLPLLTKTQIEQAKVIMNSQNDPFLNMESDKLKHEPGVEYE